MGFLVAGALPPEEDVTLMPQSSAVIYPHVNHFVSGGRAFWKEPTLSRQNVPQLDSLALDLLRTLAQKDLMLDEDAPDDAIALATLFGTSVKGLGKAQQRLIEQGFAKVVQETNRRVRASITPDGRQYLKTMKAPSSSVWWKPWAWF